VWRASTGVIHCVLYLTRFRTYKIALPPPKKTYEGRGPQTDKHLPPSAFTGQFLRKADIQDWSLLVIWSAIRHMAVSPTGVGLSPLPPGTFTFVLTALYMRYFAFNYYNEDLVHSNLVIISRFFKVFDYFAFF
jgi:hypothetical protein